MYPGYPAQATLPYYYPALATLLYLALCTLGFSGLPWASRRFPGDARWITTWLDTASGYRARQPALLLETWEAWNRARMRVREAWNRARMRVREAWEAWNRARRRVLEAWETWNRAKGRVLEAWEARIGLKDRSWEA